MTLEQLGILTGILSVICTGIYFLAKKIKVKLEKIRQTFCGKWGNEGDVILSKSETHYVELELNVDIEDGEITGTVRSSVKGEETMSPLLSVNGNLRFNTAKIELTHVQNGELLIYGKAIIKLKNKMLYWELTESIADFFPNFTRLHRQGS